MEGTKNRKRKLQIHHPSQLKLQPLFLYRPSLTIWYQVIFWQLEMPFENTIILFHNKHLPPSEFKC